MRPIFLCSTLLFSASAFADDGPLCIPFWIEGDPTHYYDCSNRNVAGQNIPIAVNADQSEIISVGQRGWASYKSQLVAPASILTLSDIENRGQSYVSDMLKALPGLSVNRSGPPGNLTQVRMRGAEASHTLVMIDGVEVSNPATGEFDFAALSALDIYKIEVLRGEQSALYGSDAIGGVINIFTNAGDAPGTVGKWISGASTRFRAGSFATFEGAAHANVKLNNNPDTDWHQEPVLSVNLNSSRTDGYDISGLNEEEDGAKQTSARFALNRVKLGDVDLYATGSWSKAKAEFDSDSDFDGHLNNTNDELTTQTVSSAIKASFELGEISFAPIDHTIGLAYTNVDTKNPFASFQNDTVGKRLKADWISTIKINHHHNWTALAEWEGESFIQFGGAGAGQNQDESIEQGALAAEYRYETDGAYILSNLVLSASVRQDFNTRFKDATTWRLGGNLALDDDAQHRVRASMGTGIKNPSMTEIFGFFPSGFVGNPNVKPERSIGYNFGYGWNAQDFGFNIDYFRSSLTDEINTDFSIFPNTVHNLATKSKREGVEIEAFAAPSDKITFKASATILATKENGIQELRRPQFSGSVTAQWLVSDEVILSVFSDHTGSQIDTDFATFSRVKLDAFTLIGANARWQLNDIITLSLRGENLLDENYQEVVGYSSQGRGVYAGITADF